jgi:hypothetical protein
MIPERSRRNPELTLAKLLSMSHLRRPFSSIPHLLLSRTQIIIDLAYCMFTNCARVTCHRTPHTSIDYLTRCALSSNTKMEVVRRDRLATSQVVCHGTIC